MSVLVVGLSHKSAPVAILERVVVSGDTDVMNDVLELDDNVLLPGSTRKAAFQSHLNDVAGRAAEAAGP